MNSSLVFVSSSSQVCLMKHYDSEKSRRLTSRLQRSARSCSFSAASASKVATKAAFCGIFPRLQNYIKLFEVSHSEFLKIILGFAQHVSFSLFRPQYLLSSRKCCRHLVKRAGSRPARANTELAPPLLRIPAETLQVRRRRTTTVTPRPCTRPR